MKKYNVVFTYNITIEAENEFEAEKVAYDEMKGISPTVEEMGIMTEEKDDNQL